MAVGPFSLTVEGWRDINHSYALVNQQQLLELAAYPDIALYHVDRPLPYANWNATRNDSGLSQEARARLRGIPPPPKQGTDVVYRIDWPYRRHGADAERLFVFLTSENHRFDTQDFCDEPQPGRRYRAEPAYVTPSAWSREGLLACGFPDAAVVPHGVDPQLFRPATGEERARRRAALGIPADSFVFLNVSAMTYNKGVDLVIVAFCRLWQRHRGIRLVLKDQSNLFAQTAAGLIGELAPQLPQLMTPEALAAIKVVSSNLGLEELRLLYASADAYVSPYRAEGFNLPPLEAAACGLPVILTRGGATDDYFDRSFALGVESARITSDQLGVYLEPRLDDLVDKMESLLEGRAGVPAGAAGRSFVSERFSWRAATRRLVDLLGGGA